MYSSTMRLVAERIQSVGLPTLVGAAVYSRDVIAALWRGASLPTGLMATAAAVFTLPPVEPHAVCGVNVPPMDTITAGTYNTFQIIALGKVTRSRSDIKLNSAGDRARLGCWPQSHFNFFSILPVSNEERTLSSDETVAVEFSN
ncbi:hypothetical protein LSTR_LSTR005459 [Laodelphax striatellus]|uniref:Uncharacterized protein n=1 Tax=Laodelphax striatellus TaxID=195883 RepID=A0A482WWG3_LAOST|nr:hypothetical protein LSTR_LSTR005459 [Laodelphax striatellus]